MKAAPQPFLKAIALDREDLVVCVECRFTWYWLADLCAREGIPFVLGHALSMQARHGGQVKHDRIDAQKIAVLRRGGLLPQADAYPAEMRVTRDLLRRRIHFVRQRAELLAHSHTTHSQDTLPAIGKEPASKANQHGMAARFPAPAVQKRMAVALALMGHDHCLLTALELTRVQTAKPPEAQTFSRSRSSPGVGKILALVRRDAIPELRRFPRGQDFVSAGRLVKGAQEAAGTRHGTAGRTLGTASLTWACSEAAGLVLRNHPAGQTSLARSEKNQGQGKARTGLAPSWARAVSYRLTRETACELAKLGPA
jgi:hypothetical protein